MVNACPPELPFPLSEGENALDFVKIKAERLWLVPPRTKAITFIPLTLLRDGNIIRVGPNRIDLLALL